MPFTKKERKWMMGRYDLHIPFELREEWNMGTVTAEQVLFLAEIESFVQHSREFTKLGIWPTNKQLAAKQGCKVRRIQQLLSVLENEGFLIITRKAGKRFIRTIWTHAIRERFTKRRKELSR